MVSYTAKTNFNRVFCGTPEQKQRLITLVEKCSRIQIHTTHFVKFYLMNCPAVDQRFLLKDAYIIIASSINRLDDDKILGSQPRVGCRFDFRMHFAPFIRQYREKRNYKGEGIKNFDQLAAYMSETFYTNITVNLQKNFIKNVKSIITALLVKRGDGELDLRRHKAATVRTAVLGNAPLPDEQQCNVLANELLGILPKGISTNGIAYDLAARPEAYAYSYVQLKRLYEKYQLRSFNAVPLSTSKVPRHLLIDTRILIQNILCCSLGPINWETKSEYWSKAFNLKNKAFKSKMGRTFNGIVCTDGISVCVVHEPPSQQKPKRKKQKKSSCRENETYVEEALQYVKNDYVVIDPYKRDLLFCLGSEGEKLRYTQQQRAVETRSKKYRKIREKLITGAGMDASPFDVRASKATCDPAGFDIYLREYFSEKFEEQEVFYQQRIFRKLRLNAYTNAQKSEARFVKKFKGAYGDGRQVSVITGDWDSGGRTFRGQAATKGKGFRAGYDVFLLDEFRTSRLCPFCGGENPPGRFSPAKPKLRCGTQRCPALYSR